MQVGRQQPLRASLESLSQLQPQLLVHGVVGAALGVVCRRHGICEQTLYRWKAKYSGMQVSDVRRLKQLEEENRKLKQLLAEATLDNQALREILAKNW